MHVLRAPAWKPQATRFAMITLFLNFSVSSVVISLPLLRRSPLPHFETWGDCREARLYELFFVEIAPPIRGHDGSVLLLTLQSYAASLKRWLRHEVSPLQLVSPPVA